MNGFENNPLKTRDDAARLLLDMVRPLKEHYSTGNAWLCIGHTAAHYGEKAARMEGFSRVLWGLGPLFSQNWDSLPGNFKQEIEEWKARYLEGIIHGTDPDHPEYWGDVADYDQKMVEMAAIATAILLAPDALWKPLRGIQREHLYRWMNQINEREVHANNWRFFRILVNVMFRVLDLTWNRERLKEDLAVIEGCYDGEGWYFDGNRGQVDYYIPFAMEYYGLLYAHFMEKEDEEYASVLKARAGSFFHDFVYWFSGDGTEIPFGRSLTYRFAHGACFSAMALAGVEGIDYGAAKGLALGNLRRWLEKPIFDETGILTIGYGYPNLFMSERYNAPGSPYWSFKTFLMLAVPEDHPFWTEEERSYPYRDRKLLSHPRMVITHGPDGHVMAYPAGQHSMNHGNCAAKYEKFVYSNRLGFSVSRGTELEEGAFDCTLAAAEAGDSNYRMRCGVDSYEVTDTYVRTKYCIMKNVVIESVVVPLGAWHVRVHDVTTDRKIDLADGGFSIGKERCFTAEPGRESGKCTPDMIKKKDGSAFAEFPWGTSGVVSLDGGVADVISPFPNTNLFYNLTVLPMVKKRLNPGVSRLITCVFGDCSEAAGELARSVPEVCCDGNKVRVRLQDTEVEVLMSGSTAGEGASL